MATFICEERLATAHDLEAALETLSQVLSNPEQVAQFKKNVRKRC